MPVLPEKREAGGFVREGAFYNGSAGCVPMVFSKIVPKLVNAGLLCLSRPEAPRSRLQRFTSAR